MNIKRKHIGWMSVVVVFGLAVYALLIGRSENETSYIVEQINIDSETEDVPQQNYSGDFSTPIVSYPDREKAITAGKNNPLIVIKNTDKGVYESDNLRFIISYPSEFETTREEYTSCNKETLNGAEKIVNPEDIYIPRHTKVPITFQQMNSGGEEGIVFKGIIGYKYLPDCATLRPVIDLAVIEKEPNFNLSTYLDGIIKLWADRRKENNIQNSEAEGPFKITKQINGEDVQVLRIKAGNGFYQYADIYYFENEKYLYSISHTYNYPDLILPRAYDHYVDELRDYEIAISAIEGFKLK